MCPFSTAKRGQILLSEDLNNAIESWRSSGSPAQQSFPWVNVMKGWLSAFPEQTAFIQGLPPALNRNDVRKNVECPSTAIFEKFLCVMIWGYGDRAYGPHRVAKVVSQDGALGRLEKTFHLARSGDPISGYSFLASEKIKYFGPAYGTKFLNFCTPIEVGAPILDAVIATYLIFNEREFKDISINRFSGWDLTIYHKYRSWILEHAIENKTFPENVELCLFRLAMDSVGSASNWHDK